MNFMNLWGKVFGKSTSEGNKSSGLNKKIEAPETALDLMHANSQREIVRDSSGEITGFWFANPEHAHDEYHLRMAAAAEKDVDSYASIALKDYRIVPNEHDDRGGCFVMIGPARAPGERVPSLTSFRWKRGEQNPMSPQVDRLQKATGIRFACPTCTLPNYCYDSDVADNAVAMVRCVHCSNISHVPAAFKREQSAEPLEIRGGVFVPIAEFGEWLFAHPSFKAEDAELLGSYGLWAFCANCKHRYASTVLVMFPVVAQEAGGMFNAHSQESARDMEALLGQRCPSCSNSNLIALLVDIPESVRESIASEKRHQERP